MSTSRGVPTALLVLVALVGAVVGAATIFWVQDRAAGGPERAAPDPVDLTAFPPSSGAAGTASTPAPPASADRSALLAWTSGGLPDGFADSAHFVSGVDAVSEVRGDLVELVRSVDADGTTVDAPDGGMVIPLDAIAIEPSSYSSFVTKPVAATIASLGPDEALLSETSAELRRLGAGARIELAGGHVFEVVAVVPDELVAAAELVVLQRADGPVTTPRYVLVSHGSDRASVEAGLLEALPVPTPIRFRSASESPLLRHGDAVLPQAHVKAEFGEFAYLRGADGTLTVDAAWAAEFLVTEHVPILGRVTCHRAVLPALRASLARLEADGLAWLVPPADYGGCYAPRIATNGHSISRHTWGMAVDLNIGKFPLGFDEDQDARLVEAMLDEGFVSGASWLVPDPAHFEWIRPVD